MIYLARQLYSMFLSCGYVASAASAVFFGPGRWVLVLLVVISSLKIPKAFLIRSGAQQTFAYTFVLTFPTDLPSQIFHLFSN